MYSKTCLTSPPVDLLAGDAVRGGSSSAKKCMLRHFWLVPSSSEPHSSGKQQSTLCDCSPLAIDHYHPSPFSLLLPQLSPRPEQLDEKHPALYNISCGDDRHPLQSLHILPPKDHLTLSKWPKSTLRRPPCLAERRTSLS